MSTLSSSLESRIRSLDYVTDVTFEQGLVTVTLEKDKSDTIDAIRAILRDESLPVHFKFAVSDSLIIAAQATKEISTVQTVEMPVLQADPYASTVIMPIAQEPAA
jgi:hypothetical protein